MARQPTHSITTGEFVRYLIDQGWEFSKPYTVQAKAGDFEYSLHDPYDMAGPYDVLDLIDMLLRRGHNYQIKLLETEDLLKKLISREEK